jgi:hypothetical protein
MQITTIGLDIAKNVFQVHGIDATEKWMKEGAQVRLPWISNSGGPCALWRSLIGSPRVSR